MSTRYQKAADALQARLMVWKRLAQQVSERGDEGEWTDTRDMWNPNDEAAMQEFEQAKAELTGARPLFKDIAS